MDKPELQTHSACSNCGSHIAPSLLACPSCHRLLHAAELKMLAAKAEQAEFEKAYSSALSFWREALALLPPEAGQYQKVLSRIQTIGRFLDTRPIVAEKSNLESDFADKPALRSWIKRATGIGSIGLVFWKFKFVIGFALTKGKLLLLGLTKAGTLWSMLASFGLYWGLWGWKFGLGLVVSIYIHEMGHVAALRKFGIKASAPTFIPGLGAMVRMRQHPASPVENARVGLTGPLWGLGAALAAYIVYKTTHMAGFAAIARVGAWINLFNLLPLPPLDGGRGFQVLNRKQGWITAACIGGVWLATAEGLLLLLFAGAVIHVLAKKKSADVVDTTGDTTAFYQYIGLVAVLSWMCMINVPAS